MMARPLRRFLSARLPRRLFVVAAVKRIALYALMGIISALLTSLWLRWGQ